MRPIKRLYSYMLQTFLLVFLMTFFICLFIFLMQFIWKYVDDMVGKGLEMSVLLEFLVYVSLSVVPMSLPLSILLASLMTFGNLGERLELLAIKAAGVSLLRIMRPLIVLIVAISVGGFFFQNNVSPYVQVKMWTLLFSMRQKSPELDIPEGAFYDQIDGINLFVKQKDRETGMLHGVMIYDLTGGFDNTMVIVADSGKLKFSENKEHLVFTLYSGESFENLKEQRTSRDNVPYRRETFSQKEILIKFDANFNRMDEAGVQNQYVGKDMAELRSSVDSMNTVSDSMGTAYGRSIQESGYFIIYEPEAEAAEAKDQYHDTQTALGVLDLDTLIAKMDLSNQQVLYSRAAARAENVEGQYNYKSLLMKEQQRVIRRHQIEMHRKFTLSLACLIFFFIGAPLGTIIRKGGFGMPVVTSVILFIFYYIVDNMGYKMARDGVWGIWEGVWLSSAVLLMLGIYLTYNAIRDSEVFNPDAYLAFFRRLLGLHEIRKIEAKEISFDEVKLSEVKSRTETLTGLIAQLVGEGTPKRQSFVAYWTKGYDQKLLHEISTTMESLIEYTQNTRNQLVILKLTQYPILRYSWLYRPIPIKGLGWLVIPILPLSLLGYLLGYLKQRRLRADLAIIDRTSQSLVLLVEEEELSKREDETNL